MKKFRNLVLSVAIIFACAFTLASCISSATTSISIAKMPKTTFTVNEEIAEDAVLVQLLITENKETKLVNLSYPDANGNVTVDVSGFEGTIQIKGFNLNAVGNYTAVVLYGSASSYFDYEVINPESGFSGGNGTVNNPYQITEAEQLKLIANDLDANYKLMNDIDLKEITEEDTVKGGYVDFFNVLIKGHFSGTLDGNGKKLYNISFDGNIFEYVNGGTLKNFDLYINGSFTLAQELYGEVLLSNVNTYGTAHYGNNYGVYTIYAGFEGDSNIKFEDCYNEVQIFSTTYCAGYVGFVGDLTQKLEFINCEFAGHIEGSEVSPYICNASSSAVAVVNYNNSVVSGSLVGTNYVDLKASYSNKLSFASEPINKAEVKELQIFELNELASFNSDGKLVLAAQNGEVATVKVQVSTMGSFGGSSLLVRIVNEYALTSAEQVTEYINAPVKDETATGANGKEVFYIGEDAYIFNGANAVDNIEWNGVGSTCNITIYCYDADGALIGATTPVKLPQA